VSSDPPGTLIIVTRCRAPVTYAGNFSSPSIEKFIVRFCAALHDGHTLAPSSRSLFFVFLLAFSFLPPPGPVPVPVPSRPPKQPEGESDRRFLGQRFAKFRDAVKQSRFSSPTPSWTVRCYDY
jgi:hypothetical protein